MAKKNERSPRWALPRHILHAKESTDQGLRGLRPPLPRRRFILAVFSMAVLGCCLLATLWIPPHSVVNKLRANGVATSAEVTGLNSYTKSVQVQFNSTIGTVHTKLYDASRVARYVKPGDHVDVTYDPSDPSQVVAQSWLNDPPYVNIAVVCSLAMVLLFGCGTAALILRRRHILRTYGPPTPTPSPPNPDEPPMSLVKP